MLVRVCRIPFRLSVGVLTCALGSSGCDDRPRASPNAGASAKPSATLAGSTATPPPAPEPPHVGTVLAKLRTPKGIAIDSGANTGGNPPPSVYVVDALGADTQAQDLTDVVRIPIGGGDVTRVASKRRVTGSPVVIAGTAGTGGRALFFTESGSAGVAGDSLTRLSLRGAAAAVTERRAFARAERGLTRAGGDKVVYFEVAPTDSKRLEVMLYDVATKQPPVRVATAEATAKLVFITADAENAYWPEAGKIMRTRLAGDGRGAPVEMVKTVYAWAAASDGTHLYFSDSPGESMGTIRRVPVGGGAVETIASGFSFPVAIALDDASVYFVNFDAAEGAVLRVPKKGGTVVALVDRQKHPKALVVDDRYVYWTNAGDGTVCRVEK